MSCVCLWSPHWRTAAAPPLADFAAALLAEAPRVAVGAARGVIWADARGLPAPRLAWALLERVEWRLNAVRAGVAAVPVAAEAAARAGKEPVTFVEPGYERAFLAPLPLALLEPEPQLAALLDGVGLHRCGELAALAREAVEVRFGAAGVALWRLTRADDARRLFAPIPPEPLHASLDFVDYEVRDAARLAFSANALLGSVCNALVARGERAREIEVELSLALGATLRERLRAARPTAERALWLRRVRAWLEALTLSAGVSGIALKVGAAEPAAGSQGDLFDRGFATAAPVEEAVARLLEAHGPLFVAPELVPHPLPERRTRWREREPEEAVGAAKQESGEAQERGSEGSALTLQLLREPRRIAVEVRVERGRVVPARYLDLARGREWYVLVTAAGPERVSGGRWEEGAYAREYFRCITETGRMLWLFRNATEDTWYLQGVWD